MSEIKIDYGALKRNPIAEVRKSRPAGDMHVKDQMKQQAEDNRNRRAATLRQHQLDVQFVLRQLWIDEQMIKEGREILKRKATAPSQEAQS